MNNKVCTIQSVFRSQCSEFKGRVHPGKLRTKQDGTTKDLRDTSFLLLLQMVTSMMASNNPNRSYSSVHQKSDMGGLKSRLAGCVSFGRNKEESVCLSRSYTKPTFLDS